MHMWSISVFLFLQAALLRTHISLTMYPVIKVNTGKRFVWVGEDSSVIPDMKFFKWNIPMCRFVPGMLCQEREILEICVQNLARERSWGMLVHLHLLTPIIFPSQVKEHLGRERNGLEWGRDETFFFFPDRDQCSAFLALPQELGNNPDSIHCV